MASPCQKVTGGILKTRSLSFVYLKLAKGAAEQEFSGTRVAETRGDTCDLGF